MDTFFQSLRGYCETLRIPLISRETEQFLDKLLEEHRPLSVLEIWAAVWYSSLFIAQKISRRWGRISSFEIGYHSYLRALKNIEVSEVSNITIYPFDMNEIHLQDFFSQKFDFVFVDAQKSQYWDYMKKIQPYLCEKNIILLDDVIKYQNKLTWLYSFLQENQINYEIYDTEPWDGVMLLKNI